MINLDSIGAIYCQLRPENIVLFFNEDQTKIENVKFLSFGNLTLVENAENILIPSSIDHMPPEMVSYLKDMKRFSEHKKASGNKEFSPKIQSTKTDFLQASSSTDIFSLGILLL